MEQRYREMSKAQSDRPNAQEDKPGVRGAEEVVHMQAIRVCYD